MDRFDAIPLMLLFGIVTLMGVLQVAGALHDYTSGKGASYGDLIFRFTAAAFFGAILLWIVVAGPEPRWAYASVPAVITLKWAALGVIGLLQRRSSTANESGNR